MAGLSQKRLGHWGSCELKAIHKVKSSGLAVWWGSESQRSPKWLHAIAMQLETPAEERRSELFVCGIILLLGRQHGM